MIIGHVERKSVTVLTTRSCSNRPTQLQRLAISIIMQICMKQAYILHYAVSENQRR